MLFSGRSGKTTPFLIHGFARGRQQPEGAQILGRGPRLAETSGWPATRAKESISMSPKEPAMNQAEMIAKWDEHIRFEFSSRDVSSTIDTMVEDAYVNHVPVMTGGYGHAALRRFYGEDFIPLMPADTSIKLISRTLGQDQLVDEMIFSFTHTEEMPWMLPGVPPTHRHVDIPLVVVVGFRDGKLAHERIYWDQASVLKQIGLLTDASLPVFGAETAQKLLDPSLPPA